MAYKYSEARRYILPPEPVIRDMEAGREGSRIMAAVMLIPPPLFALVATDPVRIYRAAAYSRNG